MYTEKNRVFPMRLVFLNINYCIDGKYMNSRIKINNDFSQTPKVYIFLISITGRVDLAMSVCLFLRKLVSQS